ncbi:TRAP-type C4-dicarboxylate transport system permease small subunit [Saccharopolyspora erythraea NRRL 2338]|uniref:C4-dicarboxylate transport system (Permease small protein) n=2 Tax=Saccharopolyspora erythraea TaxID=1836 RepID=A4FJU5_SACEN|nr:TRAP transporter small permease [Saccharopolyspora erythraea]EQD82853.1 C4-dicarboxylate ABC transporter permease [Saccharopolyspora erythraea D]PFG97961.1 TRAP-type C4-dicarboxylate transport system permease small subunit [Saccharopolyspora erythraea NRRL 2338]QRK88088.1 TRAP transporter small permease [Saccharopolyspora erythraea]CAM04320.1 C4-dicarboxylate transport system (permease small protein) [Saccharopolyspora erythraea NRRL 2338]
MTALDRLNRVRRALGGVLAGFAGALLVVMTLLVLYQVFTRYVLGSPAAFTEELVRYALIWTSMISAAYAFLHRKHMSLVVLRDRFSPAVRRTLVLGSDVLVLVFAVVVLVIGGTMLALSSAADYSALLGVSRGLVYAIGPVAGLAIAFAQLLNIWQDLISEVSIETVGTD